VAVKDGGVITVEVDTIIEWTPVALPKLTETVEQLCLCLNDDRHLSFPTLAGYVRNGP
jgi:hypothetical protein